jgi:hypothetical protein
MGDRNHEDSKRKSAATRAGVRRRRAWPAGPAACPPCGYQKDADRQLRPVPGKAAIIERVYREWVGGETQLGIARRLSAEHVPSRRSGTWHQSTVRVIIANRFYTGRPPPGDHLRRALGRP